MSNIGFNLFPVQPGRVAENNLIDKLFDGKPVQYLVRECAQNSVDASNLQRKGETARLYFHLTSLPRNDLIPYGLGVAEQHAKACSEFNVKAIDHGTHVPVLLIEDESGGLPGRVTSEQNDWMSPLGRYLFSVGTGVTGKNGKANGRHGLGSGTGAAASAIRCMYVYSRRIDGSSIASARLSLPTHVIDGKQYADEARLGLIGDDNGWLGILEDETADEMAKAFDFQVGLSTEGLSTAIIAPDESINFLSLVTTILREQFYQISKGMIEFIVSTEESGQLVKIDDTTLEAVLDEYQTKALAADNSRGRKARDPLALVRSALEVIGSEPSSAKLPEITLDTSEDIPADMRAAWLSGKTVGCRFPIKANHLEKGVAEGSIKVWMRKLEDGAQGALINVRDAIVNVRENPGYIAVVVSSDDDIAMLLGDAENPPHTQYKIRNAKDRGWVDPRPVIDAFWKGAASLQRLLVASDDASDRISLARFFPMPGALLAGKQDTGVPAETGPLGPPIPVGIGASDILHFEIDFATNQVIGTMSTEGRKAYDTGENFDLTVTFEFVKSRSGDGAFADIGAIINVESGVENGHSVSGNVLSLFGADPDLRFVIRNVDLNRDLTIDCNRIMEGEEDQ